MHFDGLASHLSNDVDGRARSRAEAEALLRPVLDDAPDLHDVICVAEVEFETRLNEPIPIPRTGGLP